MSSIGALGRAVASQSIAPTTTGLVMGAAAASLAFRPSLLERDIPTQTAVAGASFALGMGVGVAANHVLQRVARIGVAGLPSASRITAFRGGAIALGAGLGLMALPLSRERQFPFANTLETAGRIAFVAGAGSLGAQVHTVAAAALAPRVGGARLANALLIGAELAVVGGLLEYRRRRNAIDDPTTPSAKTTLVAAGAVAGGYLALKGADNVLGAVANRMPSFVKGWHLKAGAVAIAGVIGLAALSKMKGSSEDPRLREPLPTVWGPNEDQHDTTGLSTLTGFLQGAIPAPEIRSTMGGDAIDPIRIAIGFDPAESPEHRAQLAFDKLRQSGALERGRLLIAVPPGKGLVDERVPASVELMSRGDVASIAVAYSDRPSFLSLNRLDEGTRTYRHLLTLLDREKIARTARGEHFPQVLMWGNSLGAWTSQEAGLHLGVDGIAPVDRALWVGSPGPSGWRRQVVYSDDPQFADDRARTMEYSDISELDALSDAEREQVRVWMHTRESDPVGKVDVDMLWRRPLWLQDADLKDRARMPQHAAYVPGVTFLQELGDIVTTMRISEDPSRAAEGHTYVVDAVEDVANAFFPNTFDAAEQQRIERAAERHEEALRRNGTQTSY